MLKVANEAALKRSVKKICHQKWRVNIPGEEYYVCYLSARAVEFSTFFKRLKGC